MATKVDKHINLVGNFTSKLLIKLKSTTTPATGQAAIIKVVILAIDGSGKISKKPKIINGKNKFLTNTPLQTNLSCQSSFQLIAPRFVPITIILSGVFKLAI